MRTARAAGENVAVGRCRCTPANGDGVDPESTPDREGVAVTTIP